MIHPHTRLAHVSDRIGLGVVATRPIPAGTIIWVRDSLDLRIPKSRANELGPLYRDQIKHFCFWEPDGDLVLCWDHGRYINHSCNANCLGGGFEFEMAVRDIAVGEQLTDDYATFGYAHEFNCSCGAENCRGKLTQADAKWLAPKWDALLMNAMARFRSVDQPMWPLVMDKARVDQTIEHPETIPRHWVLAAAS